MAHLSIEKADNFSCLLKLFIRDYLPKLPFFSETDGEDINKKPRLKQTGQIVLCFFECSCALVGKFNYHSLLKLAVNGIEDE